MSVVNRRSVGEWDRLAYDVVPGQGMFVGEAYVKAGLHLRHFPRSGAICRSITFSDSQLHV